MLELGPSFSVKGFNVSQDMPQLLWFTKYRRIAVVTQLLLFVLLFNLTRIKLSLWGFGIAVFISACISFLVEFKIKSFTPGRLGFLLIVDTVILTAMLYFSGGANNPFSVFFIAQVALAAILIGERWTWILALLSSIFYGALFFFFVEIPVLSSHSGHGGHSFSIHLQGMWLAFAILAATQAFFFTKIVRALKEREMELRELSIRAERSERLASVTALAANAAHELNTPLSSIKLTAGEIVEKLNKISGVDGAKSDAALILSEVTRCGSILSKLRQEAGDIEGQIKEEIPLEVIGMDLKKRFYGKGAERIQIDESALNLSLRAPKRPLSEALGALVKNGLEAAPTGIVKIFAKRDKRTQEISVKDSGPGINKEILPRIGEPFFTTKEGGRGLGLGVFLARSFIEKLGGELILQSESGTGTSAIMKFPVDHD
jgi:two-component system sensor histidine kinase RegB